MSSEYPVNSSKSTAVSEHGRAVCCFSRKEGSIIFLVVLFAQLISMNLAWLNPWHQDSWFRPLCVISKEIPFLWQYDYDAPWELRMAQRFPDFNAVPSRTNRPLHYGVVHAVGQGIGFVAGPIFPTLGRYRFEAAFIVSNAALAWLFGVVGFAFLVRYIDRRSALLAVCLPLTVYFSIKTIGIFHTYIYQLLTPAIILFLFSELSRTYTHARNVLFSLLIGLLMLAKPTYGVYVGVLCFVFLRGRYLESMLSFAVHFIPTVLWIGTLRLLALEYHNSEIEEYGQGVWIFRDFIYMSIPRMVKVFVGWLLKYGICALGIYSLWLATVWVGFRRLREEGPARDFRGIPLFLGVLLFWNWAQMFASVRYQGYMTADLALPVFGLAAYGISGVIERRDLPLKWTAFGFVGLIAAWVGVRSLHLPIIMPYNAPPLLLLPIGFGACAIAVMSRKKSVSVSHVLVGLFLLWVLWNMVALVEFPWISPSAQLLVPDGR